MIPSQAWQVKDHFGVDQLTLVDVPCPQPREGEVLVALEAQSLNFRDLLMVEGRYNRRQPLPLVPGSDGAGRVVEVGAGVSRLAVGDRVAPIFSQLWWDGDPTPSTYASTLGGPLDGTFRRHLVLPEGGWVRVPPSLSTLEAATLPCAAVTAWNALFDLGSLAAGETVLILGTGGVALFALQLAVRQGARVLITSSRDDKIDRALALGASAGINYRRVEEWGRQARALTEGRGVDQVIELGGAATLEQSLLAVRPGGTISLIGNLGGNEASLSVIPILMRQIRVQGVMVGSRRVFESLVRELGDPKRPRLEPVIDRVFGFAELPQAFEYLQSAEHFGKVCLRCDA